MAIKPIDIENFFQKAGVRRGFGATVMAEVAAFQKEPGLNDPVLKDLVSLPFVTIDNENSKDLDQALYIESGAGFIVYYALADGSFYVRPGSALFKEALLRGASFYLPGICEPMLPRELSEDLVSLNPGVDRRAMIFEMHLDQKGICTETRIYRARIRSRAKLSYEGVQHFIDTQKGSIAETPFVDSLLNLKKVGLLRMAEARRRSVIRFDRSEIQLSRDNRGFKVIRGNRNAVSRYNEQISLLCNTEGAKFLSSDELEHVQPVYRVHPAPSLRKLKEVATRIARITASHELSAEWRWNPEKEPLGDYLERLPRVGPLSRLTLTISRQIRYTFQRSDFSPSPGIHFGVGAPAYCRFSSPMREVVGIFTHKEAIEKLQGRGQDNNLDRILREEVIKSANAAKTTQSSLQKSVHKLALDVLFRPELKIKEPNRKRYKGTVLGMRGTKLYVEFDNPPVEVKVYVGDLSRKKERFEIRDEDVVLRSKERTFRLGEAVDVWVRGYDERRGRWQLQAEVC